MKNFSKNIVLWIVVGLLLFIYCTIGNEHLQCALTLRNKPIFSNHYLDFILKSQTVSYQKHDKSLSCTWMAIIVVFIIRANIKK